MEAIQITTPAAIRGYTPGGKGGYGYSSTPLHRLTLRDARADHSACGVIFKGKSVVTDGVPKPALVRKYGQCVKCWGPATKDGVLTEVPS